jgi:hypothetical protein
MFRARWIAMFIISTSAATGCTTSGGSTTHGKTSSPVQNPSASVGCASPVTGSRYSLCGHLTSAAFGAPGATYTVQGAPDSTMPTTGDTNYNVSGGGFYAATN